MSMKNPSYLSLLMLKNDTIDIQSRHIEAQAQILKEQTEIVRNQTQTIKYLQETNKILGDNLIKVQEDVSYYQKLDQMFLEESKVIEQEHKTKAETVFASAVFGKYPN